jgi:hypothetical protein
MHEIINETVFKILEHKRTNFFLPQKQQQLYERICNFMNGFEVSYQMHEIINETVFKILERKRTNFFPPTKERATL